MAPFASGVASDIPQAVLPGCLDFYIIVFPVSLLVFVSLVTLWSFGLVALCRLIQTPGE